MYLHNNNLILIRSSYSDKEFKKQLNMLVPFIAPNRIDDFIAIKVCFSASFEIKVGLANIIKSNLDIQHNMVNEFRRISKITQGDTHKLSTFLLNLFKHNLDFVLNDNVHKLRAAI